MAREVPEIDRLIEEGLTLYGQGDLDGALLQWERALAIDPDNAQANSYFDYVRANYELLTTDAGGEKTAEGVPFGIADDEPEYQIEIQPGEIKPSIPERRSAPMALDPVDEGWTIDDEAHSAGAYSSAGEANGQTLEMEADEPPEPTRPARAASEPGVSFDDATREYAKRQTVHPPPSEHSGFGPLPTPAGEFMNEETPGFGHPNDFQTPQGFGTQTTGIKKRDDMGFVQPMAPAAAQTQPGPMIQRPPMTATQLGLPDRPRTPAPSHPPANMMDELTLDPVEPTIPEKQTKPDTRGAPVKTTPPINAAIAAADLDDMDLISSLPSPRPAPSVPQVEISTPLSGSRQPAAEPAPPPTTKVTTRDFPHQVTRGPAPSTAPTREIPPGPVVASSATQDFDAKTTERKGNYDQTSEIPNMAQAALVSAPTRDLGLRDMPAGMAEQRDGTRADVMLSFDPIDARATEIIEDVDEAAPANEAKEDQTRRRITTLFEKASQWSSEGDLERAVAAVDLALSEDPNAALAQKLIHRNRDTIMSVFQAYLGDLQRTPQLARPLHELASAPISPRAAFLLSRIDGGLSIDEILDVCGMPRLEAYRYLCQLFLRGILR